MDNNEHLYWTAEIGGAASVWASRHTHGLWYSRLYAATMPTIPPSAQLLAWWRSIGYHVTKITCEDCEALIVAARARHALEGA